MDRPLAQICSVNFRWGYWLGGLLCGLSLLSMSFGITPLIVVIRSKTIVMDLPGQQAVNLKLPGAYLAFYVSSKFPPEAVQRIYDMQFALTDKLGKESEVVKIPPRKYASEQGESQIPLFQFFIDKAGDYELSAGYPYDLEGPKVSAVLVYMDYKYVRTELIVGMVLSLVFAVLGIYFIFKTRRASRLR